MIEGPERGDAATSTRRAPSRNNYNRGHLCRMAHMKRLLIALVGSLVVLSAHAADARGTIVDKPVVELARLLQARLPALSVDGMLEAEREAHGWVFNVRVKSDQGGADEVQVIVRESSNSSSELRVQGVRIDSNLFTSKRGVNAALTAEWTDKILKLVEKVE